MNGPKWSSWIGVGVVALLLSSALPSLGQNPTTWGLYYKEIRKEDRIFVFNIPAEAERFEASGEMGRSITKLGAGPEGQTVVGDSERALQLFFFRHGLAEPVPDPVTPRQQVEWRDGKTRITTDLAYLEISNRIQVRYTHEIPTENNVVSGSTLDPGESRGSFRLRRAKLKLEGWMWLPPEAAPALPKVTYEMQLNWPGLSSSNLAAFLEDANIAFDPTGRAKFRVRVGQFKVPFGRQEMTSSGSQQFVDRSLVSNEYARGRDTGVAVEGALGNKIEYRAGIFNGNGLTRSTNDNAALQFNARLMWQPNGLQTLAQRAWVSGALYSESDFESTTTPIYAFGLSVEHSDFRRTTTSNDLNNEVVALDGIFKYKGISAVSEIYLRKRVPEVGDAFRAHGGYGQLGVMLNSRRTWEIAVRYGLRDVNNRNANDSIQEVRVASSYYYRRHTLKFQIDGGQIRTNLGSAGGHRLDYDVRAQSQFIF
jgi:hypothetical protein